VRDSHISERSERVNDLERLLLQARAQNLLPAHLPSRAAAVGLHALLDGLMSNWLLEPQAFDLEQVGAQALDAYLAGLAVSGA
jgi:TetR/AcrR family acrAB operon transcriptional repressor